LENNLVILEHTGLGVNPIIRCTAKEYVALQKCIQSAAHEGGYSMHVVAEKEGERPCLGSEAKTCIQA